MGGMNYTAVESTKMATAEIFGYEAVPGAVFQCGHR